SRRRPGGGTRRPPTRRTCWPGSRRCPRRTARSRSGSTRSSRASRRTWRRGCTTGSRRGRARGRSCASAAAAGWTRSATRRSGSAPTRTSTTTPGCGRPRTPSPHWTTTPGSGSPGSSSARPRRRPQPGGVWDAGASVRRMDVRLRGLVDDDLDRLFAWEQEPAEGALAAFTRADPSERTAFDEHYARTRSDPSCTVLAVEHAGTFVATVGSFTMDGEREVTYWVDPDRWGRGIASAALTAFLEVERERPLVARVAA